MNEATGLAEALLELDRFRVLDLDATPDEVIATVETTTDVVGRASCPARARRRIGRGSISRTRVLWEVGPRCIKI
jgi:hypothetical protein